MNLVSTVAVILSCVGVLRGYVGVSSVFMKSAFFTISRCVLNGGGNVAAQSDSSQISHSAFVLYRKSPFDILDPSYTDLGFYWILSGFGHLQFFVILR
jgi:hypothetical protein